MAKEADVGALVEIYGGEFRLAAIVQKRLRELVRGARPLVDVGRGRKDLIDIVLRELEEGRIEPTEGLTETPKQDIFGTAQQTPEKEAEEEEKEEEEEEEEDEEEEDEEEEEQEKDEEEEEEEAEAEEA